MVTEAVQASRDISLTDKQVCLCVLNSQPKSMQEIERRLVLSRMSVRRACVSLGKAGWVRMVTECGCKRPILLLPAELQEALLRKIRDFYALAPLKGEYLFRTALDLVISSREFTDNARPEFLANPAGSGVLEYDRYYPEDKLAFEFNGLQHYGVTQRFSNEDEHNSLRTRDLLKKALSTDNGITLIILTHKDLNLKTISKLVPKTVAKNSIDFDGPLAEGFNRLCSEYKNRTESARREQQGKGS